MSNTTSYSRRKKSETIANQVIGKVIYGKTDASILNELTNLTEYIERKNYSQQEVLDYLPHFADRTFAEMVMIHKEISSQLFIRIKQPERTFLQTYRIYIALSVLEPEKHIPLSNPKIKFCARFFADDHSKHLSESFKTIKLIDICMFAAQGTPKN